MYGTISTACVYKPLPRGVRRAEVRTYERVRHMVATVRHHTGVMRVAHIPPRAGIGLPSGGDMERRYAWGLLTHEVIDIKCFCKGGSAVRKECVSDAFTNMQCHMGLLDQAAHKLLMLPSAA